MNLLMMPLIIRHVLQVTSTLDIQECNFVNLVTIRDDFLSHDTWKCQILMLQFEPSNRGPSLLA